MKDPTRLLEDGHALTDVERRALSAARDVRPPPEIEREIWGALAAKLPAVGGGAAGAAGSAGSAGGAANGATSAGPAIGGVHGAAATASLVKAIAIGAALGGAALGARWGISTLAGSEPRTAVAPIATAVEQRRDTKGPNAEREPSMRGGTAAPAAAGEDPRPTVSAPPAAGQPSLDAKPLLLQSELPSVPTAESEPSSLPTANRARKVEIVAPGRPAADAAAEGPMRDRAGGFSTSIAAQPSAMQPIEAPSAAGPAWTEAREETRVLAKARALLLAGRASEASSLLDRASARFGSGVLVQEREALAIEALVASGQREAAARRAEAFLHDFPESPYTARVRALTAR